MTPVESQWWWMALDNLESEYPELLEGLLEDGSLHAHLDDLVQAAWDATGRAQERAPKGDPRIVREVLQATMIAPVNPDSKRRRLPPGMRKLLATFREKAETEAEALGESDRANVVLAKSPL